MSPCPAGGRTICLAGALAEPAVELADDLCGVEGLEQVAVSSMLGHEALKGGHSSVYTLVAHEDEERVRPQTLERMGEAVDLQVLDVKLQPVDQHKVGRLQDDLEFGLVDILSVDDFKAFRFQSAVEGDLGRVVGLADEHFHVTSLRVFGLLLAPVARDCRSQLLDA